MTMTIELPPDVEAGLTALAETEGLALPQLVQRILRERIAVSPTDMSPAERAQAWRASVAGLPSTPPLSDEAMSRESIYGARG